MYASVVFGYILITIFLNAYEYTSNRKKLSEISENNDNKILVKRKNEKENEMILLNVKQLVIGDIVELKINEPIPCDLLLLSGNVLVNEALLTGESVPINK